MAADNNTEHQVRAELIERLSPFYDPDHHSVVNKILHIIRSPFNTHYQPTIDTSGYSHKSLSEYSERQIVNRTVFALKKILTFNHHYFDDHEARVLKPYPSGALNRGLTLTCAGVDAAFAAIIFRNYNFNAKSMAFLSGLLIAQYFIIRTPNYVNNLIQGPSRRNLAQKYIDAYGAEYFHKIIDPRYDIEKLRHLENKLNAHH